MAQIERTAYFATVHWRSEDWIDLQLDAIRRHCRHPFRLHAFLNHVAERFHARFDQVHTEEGMPHPDKLNLLAAEICEQAADSDILVFIDGDAFPVADLAESFAALERYPLVAARRYENNGDLQPHPCFCVTTVGFWKQIEGDWRGGGYWKNLQGQPVTDVGGRLLNALEERDIDWLPLDRSNARDLHPLWFGVYGGLVYHHGAGFRDKLCRLDALNGVDRLSSTLIGLQRRLRLQRRLPRFNGWLTRQLHNYMRRKNSRLAEQVYASIIADPDFCRRWGFIESPVVPA
ncbi:MAG: hypothetical protein QNI86_07405 [Halieaceae bacterium]|nr:hypothetical protein [Halieaceae bacterium]